MKGIILAGGNGTRLFPLTKVLSKQLLPINDKPMVYYPLSTLMLAGIKDILIISNPEFINFYRKLFRNGKQLGIKISYQIQKKPKGIADAFLVSKTFLKNGDDCCLILGDNIFYGQDLTKKLFQASKIVKNEKKAVIFTYNVNNPTQYGVLEEKNNKIFALREKPKNTKSKKAIVGLYFYPGDVTRLAKNLKPSNRGELEITDLNKTYLQKNKLDFIEFNRGFAWFDAGTHDDYQLTNQFIFSIEKRLDQKLACIEEIAYLNKWINKKQLINIIKNYSNSDYVNYLRRLII